MASAADAKGKLRIGDDWDAIRIIALSQSNPLNALAELVENSIDAHARKITITRGREHGENYLAIRDDGDGVPRDANGIPDFRYVATHICDSVKRRLKSKGTRAGIQCESRNSCYEILAAFPGISFSSECSNCRSIRRASFNSS